MSAGARRYLHACMRVAWRTRPARVWAAAVMMSVVSPSFLVSSMVGFRMCLLSRLSDCLPPLLHRVLQSNAPTYHRYTTKTTESYPTVPKLYQLAAPKKKTNQSTKTKHTTKKKRQKRFRERKREAARTPLKVTLVLRGTTVNRTCGIHKILYI